MEEMKSNVFCFLLDRFDNQFVSEWYKESCSDHYPQEKKRKKMTK